MNAIIVMDTRDYCVYINMSDSALVSIVPMLDEGEYTQAEQAAYFVNDHQEWCVRNGYHVEVFIL